MSVNVTQQDAESLLAFLTIGEQLGVEFPTHLAEKLARLEEGDRPIKVALVGGFSVGKTSVAAAWLGKPREDMKISHGESSSAVTVYNVDGNIQLIDTPGLFGFKEKGIESGKAEAYREMTRKYVSEADLLLYVLNPSNPIKESHKEELNWLFRDLNLLPRTVFVIGSFDQVADLEDEGDFAKKLGIKKDNVVQRLKDLINLTSEEAGSLSIVAVSANPFDEGYEHWVENPDEFRKLSRIGELQKATSRQLEIAGGPEAVKAQTALSIVRDVVQRQMVPITIAARTARRLADEASEKAREEFPRLERYKREAGTAQRALRNWVLDYFNDLIVEARNTGQEEFGDFFVRNLGEGGKVLEERVALRFEEELGPISTQLNTMGMSFLDTSSDWSWVGSIGKGAATLGNSGIINNTSILAARDALNLGIKFKPYGAIKLAAKANVALAAVGPAIEGFRMIKKILDNREFEQTRTKIISALEEQRNDLTEVLKASDFTDVHFPQLAQMQALFETIRRGAAEARDYAEQIQKWAEKGRELCHRFGIQAPELPDESHIIDV